MGQLGEWRVHHNQAETVVKEFEVQAGDTVDLVVDFQGEITHDEHEWTIRLSADNGRVWDSVEQFRGPAADRWQQWVHALMMTNEFVFID